jgi:hypothetical protein
LTLSHFVSAAANQQNKACGLDAQQWNPPTASVQSAFATLQSFLTGGGVTEELLTLFDDSAVWREPVGKPSAYLRGAGAIRSLLLSLNSTSRWTSTLTAAPPNYDFDSTGPLFSGNTVGFTHTITFTASSGCLYSIPEFVSVIVGANGRISDFDVYYDDAQHWRAKMRCQ